MGTRTVKAAAGAAAGLLIASGIAHGVASWTNQPYQLTIPTHINGRGQSVSSSVDLTLNHDAACTLSFSANSGDEVLHNGGSSLTTQYKLQGVHLSNSDTNWVDSADFVQPANLYTMIGTGPTDTVTLWVRGTAPAGTDPPSGDYTAVLTVTASWP